MTHAARKAVKKIARFVPELIAEKLFVVMVSFLNREGKFIPKKDFERMIDTDDRLILVTPLGDFRVTPVADYNDHPPLV